MTVRRSRSPTRIPRAPKNKPGTARPNSNFAPQCLRSMQSMQSMKTVAPCQASKVQARAAHSAQRTARAACASLRPPAPASSHFAPAHARTVSGTRTRAAATLIAFSHPAGTPYPIRGSASGASVCVRVSVRACASVLLCFALVRFWVRQARRRRDGVTIPVARATPSLCRRWLARRMRSWRSWWSWRS